MTESPAPVRRVPGVAPDTWSGAGQAAALFLHGRTARTAAPVALIVGTLLSAVNQGSVIAHGHLGIATWTRVAANYCIPFCVASYGWLAARRRHPSAVN